MRKCAIYIRNENDPASFYRIIQYLGDLKCEYNIRSMYTNAEYVNSAAIRNRVIKKIYQLWLLIKMYCRGISYLQADIKEKVDFVYIERTIIPRVSFKKVNNLLIKLLNNAKLIWDFDDNILASGEIYLGTAKLFEKEATQIIVTHEYLKQTLSEKYQDKVLLLPTTDNYIPALFSENRTKLRLATYSETISLVWVGTSANLQFLRKIIRYLDTAAEKLQEYGKKLELRVVCNQTLEEKCNFLYINNIKWDRNIAIEEIYRAHIGVMPLDDTEYTRGKGAFKLLQYMASGLPVIASPVGFNVDVLSDCCGYLANSQKEWMEAILKLSIDKKIWIEQSETVRDRFIKKFNPARNIEVLNEVLNS